jgi:hypothetical protein
MSDAVKDSNFRVFEDLMQHAPDDIWWYMVVPDRMPDESIEAAQKRNPKTTFVKADWVDDFWTEQCYVPRELLRNFMQRGGKYPIDAVVTSKTPAVATMAAMLGDFRRTDMLPFHIFEPLVRLEQTKYEPFHWAMTSAYGHAQTWFLNHREREIAQEYSRGFTSPKRYLKSRDDGYVDGLGIDTEAIDKAIAGKKPGDRFQVIWGGRITAEKNPDDFIELMDKFYSFGRDVKHIVTSHQISPKQAFKMKGGFIEELALNCPRDEFWGKVAESNMFLCTSKTEGFPVGFWEQLYIAEVGIFPNNEWVKKSLPADYPYIYNGISEAHAMIRWISENYDEARAKVGWIRQFIRERYDSKLIGDRFANRLRDSIDKASPVTRLGGIGDLVKEVVDGKDEIVWDDLTGGIRKLSRNYDPRRISKLGQPSIYDLHQYMKSLGYIDTCEADKPTYRRAK